MVNYEEEILNKFPIASQTEIRHAIDDASNIADALLQIAESEVPKRFAESICPFWTKIMTVNYITFTHIRLNELDLIKKETEIYSLFQQHIQAKKDILPEHVANQLANLFNILLEYDTTILDAATKISDDANYLAARIDFNQLTHSLSATLLALVSSMHAILDSDPNTMANARIIISLARPYVETVESYIDTIQILSNSEELAILHNSVRDIIEGRISEV